MSASSYEYKLFGFSRDLDWRPLCLLSPMPAARICSVCGVVPRSACYLLCGHLLCKRCYERCRVEGAIVCPLDHDVCPQDDILWRSFPMESLAIIQAKCWNEASGCNVTAAASDISRHFQEDCEYHVINCPKCSGKMRSGDLYAHVSSCGGLAEPSAARLDLEHDVDERESQQGSSHDHGRVLHDLSAQDNPSKVKAMEGESGSALGASAQDAAALKAAMELSSSHNDRLRELEQTVTALKDILDTQRNHTKKQIKRDKKVAAGFKKKSERHAAALAALNKKLQVLNAQVDELCVLRNMHTGVFERFSACLNVIDAEIQENMADAESRGGVGGSAGNATVAERNILAGGESRDTRPNQIAEAKNERNVDGELDTLKARLEIYADSMQASLEELYTQNKVITDRLNSLSNSIDVLQSWKESLDQSASRSQSKAACSAVVAENTASEGTLSSILAIVRNFGTGIKSHSWVLRGIRALKKTATQAGEVCHMSESVYLRGYLMSPGVVIKGERGSLWLHFCLQFHKGVMDDDLRWPFEHEAKFSIIHPKDRKQREIHVDRPNNASLIESRGGPVMHFATSSFDMSLLEKKAYIKNNQLTLKLELLSSR